MVQERLDAAGADLRNQGEVQQFAINEARRILEFGGVFDPGPAQPVLPEVTTPEAPKVEPAATLRTEKPLQALRRAIKELKASPTSPELTTAYWRAKMAVDGKIAKVEISVVDCDRTAEEIEQLREKGRTLVYYPHIGLVTLDKMYPRMQSWVVQEGTTVVNGYSVGQWLDIESAVDSPNLDTTGDQAADIFKSQGLAGQRLSTYILGSQASKDLTGYYFDESSRSRLPGSRSDNGVVGASFGPGGNLHVSGLSSWNHYPDLGARSEGVKST